MAVNPRPRTVSVVIPACNEGRMLDMTVRSVLASENRLPFEIVVVDDGSTDGSCDSYRRADQARVRVVDGGGLGVARARNLGAAYAEGEMLVFLDAHCEVPPRWLDGLASAMDAPDVAIVSPAFTRLGESYPVGLGVGWASPRLDLHWFLPVEGARHPYEIPLAPGGCQAYPASTFRAVGRFDEGFMCWGSEDIEISLRAWLLGYRVVAQSAVSVGHWFRDTRGFAVPEADIAFNHLRMVRQHFTDPRLGRVIEAMGTATTIREAESRLAQSDVDDRRKELMAVRERDDGWFCQTFFPGLLA